MRWSLTCCRWMASCRQQRRSTRSRWWRSVCPIATVSCPGRQTAEGIMTNGTHWVGTWTAAPAPAEGAAFANQTLRMNARASVGGETLRVRISNAYGTKPLLIGAAHIGVRKDGPAIVADTDRVLTFGGEPSATIAAGALLISD